LAACGAASAEREVWDVLRTEAGLPVYGVDVDETTTMPELGERGISYDKGCYIGQEVVARVKYIGHVNRRFVGFLIEGEVVPAPRTVLRSGGRDVGYLTTALYSPALGRPMALGFVNRAAAAPGSAVEVLDPGGPIAAVVATLPLVPSRIKD
jgi:folate-binding protein YgfZ